MTRDKAVHEPPIGMLMSPLILGALVLLIFFFPNQFSKLLLIPAWSAILPSLAQTGELTIKISAWHGWNPELYMTLGVIGLGSVLYLFLKYWFRLYRFYPDTLTLNHLYNLGLDSMENASRSVTNRYMTGFIRDYLVYIFLFIILIIGSTLYLFEGFAFDPSQDAPINMFEVGLMVAMVISAVTVLFSKSRMTSVIAVGALGFLVSFFFVLFRAPDLALTQLVVETVTTALFLLCFKFLPELKKEISRIPFKVGNALISLGIGGVITLVALSANGTHLFDSISSYYEKSYELAGAKNIVNAILVDFRGIDTMLEILVLCIAGLGVYTLIKLRLTGRDKNEGA